MLIINHSNKFDDAVETTFNQIIALYEDTKGDLEHFLYCNVMTAAHHLPNKACFYALKKIIEQVDYPKILMTCQGMKKCIEKMDKTVVTELIDELKSTLLKVRKIVVD